MNEPSGFSFKRNKDNSVIVYHRGKKAVALSRVDGAEFLDEIADLSDPESQHLMARLTGNYKRGNERLASSHFRNQTR